MTEPATAIAGAAVAGLGAGFLTALGIEPQPLFWSLVGASIGMSFAAASSKTRAATIFIAVVLVCSLFGAWLAQRYFAGELLSRNAIACGLAIGFHPALNAAITRLPLLFDGLIRKWFGVGSQP